MKPEKRPRVPSSPGQINGETSKSASEEKRFRATGMESETVVDMIMERLDARLNQFEEKLESKFLEISTKITEIDTKLKDVVDSNEFASKEIDNLKERFARLEEENDRLAAYVARENLVFLGLPEVKEPGKEDVSKTLQDLYINNLKLPPDVVDKIEYQRVHRVPSQARPRPIKARFFKYSDKELVQRNAKELKGSGMYITDDLPWRIRKERKKQLPALKAAKAMGKSAYFSRSDPTKLFVNNVLLPQREQAAFIEKANLDPQNRRSNPGPHPHRGETAGLGELPKQMEVDQPPSPTPETGAIRKQPTGASASYSSAAARSGAGKEKKSVHVEAQVHHAQDTRHRPVRANIKKH